MLPLRAICEYLGAEVLWEDGTIVIKHENDTVYLRVGSDSAKINDTEIKMNISPKTYDGTTVISAEFISTALGYDFKYEDMTAKLSKKN